MVYPLPNSVNMRKSITPTKLVSQYEPWYAECKRFMVPTHRCIQQQRESTVLRTVRGPSSATSQAKRQFRIHRLAIATNSLVCNDPAICMKLIRLSVETLEGEVVRGFAGVELFLSFKRHSSEKAPTGDPVLAATFWANQ